MAKLKEVVTNLISRVQEELTRGNSVTIDGLVTFGTSLTARMDTMVDPLPKDAKLKVSTRAHPALAENLRQQATLERVTAPTPGPVLQQLQALFGDKRGIGCGDVMELKGARLRFDPYQEDAGVFFIDSGTNMEYRAKNYIDIEEKRLTFLVPEITGQVVHFELRARRPHSEVLHIETWPRLIPCRRVETQ